MKLPKITLSSLFAICYLLFAITPAHAEVSLVVSPPRYDATIDPGETIQKTIKVTNNSEDQIVSLQANITDFIVQDDAGTPIPVEDTQSGRYLASPWFTLDSEGLILQPKESKQLTVLITVPNDALPGGHYAGVFFRSITNDKTAGTASSLIGQVGSLFGITVNGDITYDALVKDFSTKSFVSEYGPIEFSAIVENQSDTHIRPLSTITIHDMLGRKLDSITLEELNIFPYTSRTLNGIWDTTWGLGRYTATIDVSYGPGLVADRTIYFWIMPYRIILAIIIIILVLLASYISIRRHILHRTDGRDEEIDSLQRRIAELENK
ncbi:MAG: hypothetical protein DRG59_09625 [Deltaproteobacteria bacterium]|nr:MAG: hypothetical protein DRG59_09625 [Deltaproteobacteria bacterium]